LKADGLTDDSRADSWWVLPVGNGTVRAGDSESTWVTILDSFFIRTNGDRVDALIDCVYDYFGASYCCLEYLAARAIVCPTNTVVDAINDRVASRVPSKSREYLSADKVVPGSEQIPNVNVLYTEDILNAITQPNYPEHRLVLKVGMPVLL
jgi:hypothetical protein